MDANDGVGLELRNCRHREVDTQCISPAGARREHVAGKRVGEMMEKHHMTSALAEPVPVDENMSEEQLTTAVAALRQRETVLQSLLEAEASRLGDLLVQEEEEEAQRAPKKTKRKKR